MTGRGKAAALRGDVSGCEVEEAPLPLGEESADAWELQQWDNHLHQGEMGWPNAPNSPFPPLALVVQSALVVLCVPVESREHVRRKERAVGLKVLPGALQISQALGGARQLWRDTWAMAEVNQVQVVQIEI